MITSNINKKFYLITKKYPSHFKISYFDFYQHILKKNKSQIITICLFLKNLFLILLSLYVILKIFLFYKNIKSNYFIIKKNGNSYIDPRSQFYIKKKNIKFKLNFVRSENFFDSIIIFFLYSNIIFINSFKYFINFFIRISAKDNFYDKKIKQNFFFYLIIKKIFIILKIKNISLIDDYRIAPLFLKICDELNIPSVGYMHGRISKYNILHKYFAFNRIYVWSNYFKDKLIQINNEYTQSKKIIVKRAIKIPQKFINNFKRNKRDYTKINLLYVLDEVTNARSIISNIKKIKKYKNINLLIKFRPSENVNKILVDFCLNNSIKFFYKEDIYHVFLKQKINFLISSYSTVLIESSLIGIYPLMVLSRKDLLSKELIYDKAVIPVYSFNNFYNKIIKLKNNKKILKSIKEKIWQ